MQSWQHVLRNGLFPLLSPEVLLVLRDAVKADAPNLCQGATTVPPPLKCVSTWPVEAACPIGYCGWQGEGLQTVGEVEAFFAQICYHIDQAIGEPTGCRMLLNWLDETPRPEMLALLLPELDAELTRRAGDSGEITAEAVSSL